jgi:hypothetical protein
LVFGLAVLGTQLTFASQEPDHWSHLSSPPKHFKKSALIREPRDHTMHLIRGRRAVTSGLIRDTVDSTARGAEAHKAAVRSLWTDGRGRILARAHWLWPGLAATGTNPEERDEH